LAELVVITANSYLHTRQERENLHVVVKYFGILHKSVRGFIKHTRGGGKYSDEVSPIYVFSRSRGGMFTTFCSRRKSMSNERDHWENQRAPLFMVCLLSFISITLIP
jgi:hypothetical protein